MNYCVSVLMVLFSANVCAEISSTPTPAIAGNPVTLFSSDDTTSLDWTIYAGDGTPSKVSGNPVQFTPLKPGGYFVVADKGERKLEILSVAVTNSAVDSDLDGVPNELELSLGSNPTDVNSKPIGLTQPMGWLSAETVKIKLNPNKTNNDGILINRGTSH